MSFFSDSTANINSKIDVLKAISNKATKKGLSKYKELYSNVNSLMDSIMSIFNQIGGYEDMVKSIENILSNKIEDIEEVIKSSIKTSLKQIISCGVEPTIGDQLILTGITFDIKKIDPLAIFNIDPTSENGTYAYFDNFSGVNSSDFNVYLYEIIKKSINDPTYKGDDWYKTYYNGNEKVKTMLFKTSFVEYDEITNKSNQLTIKISEDLRGEKLSYFISEYLDTIKLFNNIQVISSIFDDILGAKILSINKTSDQITIEKTISKLVDKIINGVDSESDVIDDSFYIFSNDTYNQLLEDSDKKKNGVFSYNKAETNENISIDNQLLLDSLNNLKTDSILVSDQTKILTNAIDNLTNDLVDKNKVKTKNSFSFKFDFIKEIITKLTTTIACYIFAPKIIYLFSMTSKLYGFEDPDDVVTFIKKNINIYKMIIIKIRDIIIQILIDKIKEMLMPLLQQVSIELVKEKFSMYKKQIDGIRQSIEGVTDTVNSLIEKSNETSISISDKADNITSKTT